MAFVYVDNDDDIHGPPPLVEAPSGQLICDALVAIEVTVCGNSIWIPPAHNDVLIWDILTSMCGVDLMRAKTLVHSLNLNCSRLDLVRIPPRSIERLFHLDPGPALAFHEWARIAVVHYELERCSADQLQAIVDNAERLRISATGAIWMPRHQRGPQ